MFRTLCDDCSRILKKFSLEQLEEVYLQKFNKSLIWGLILRFIRTSFGILGEFCIVTCGNFIYDLVQGFTKILSRTSREFCLEFRKNSI